MDIIFDLQIPSSLKAPLMLALVHAGVLITDKSKFDVLLYKAYKYLKDDIDKTDSFVITSAIKNKLDRFAEEVENIEKPVDVPMEWKKVGEDKANLIELYPIEVNDIYSTRGTISDVMNDYVSLTSANTDTNPHDLNIATTRYIGDEASGTCRVSVNISVQNKKTQEVSVNHVTLSRIKGIYQTYALCVFRDYDLTYSLLVKTYTAEKKLLNTNIMKISTYKANLYDMRIDKISIEAGTGIKYAYYKKLEVDFDTVECMQNYDSSVYKHDDIYTAEDFVEGGDRLTYSNFINPRINGEAVGLKKIKTICNSTVNIVQECVINHNTSRMITLVSKVQCNTTRSVGKLVNRRYNTVKHTEKKVVNKHATDREVNISSRIRFDTSRDIYQDSSFKFNIEREIVFGSRIKHACKRFVVGKYKDKYNAERKVIVSVNKKFNVDRSVVNVIKNNYNTCSVVVKKVKHKHSTCKIVSFAKKIKMKHITSKIVVKSSCKKHSTDRSVVNVIKNNYNTCSVVVKKVKHKHSTCKIVSFAKKIKMKHITSKIVVKSSCKKHSTDRNVVNVVKNNYNTCSIVEQKIKSKFNVEREVVLDVNNSFSTSRVVEWHAKVRSEFNTERSIVIDKVYKANSCRRTVMEWYVKKDFNTVSQEFVRSIRAFNTIKKTDLLSIIKELMNITDNRKDTILRWYIEKAKDDILAYTNRSCEEVYGESPLIPVTTLNFIIADLVIYMERMRGQEHLKSEGAKGVNWSYITDIPVPIQRRLKPYVKRGKLRVL